MIIVNIYLKLGRMLEEVLVTSHFVSKGISGFSFPEIANVMADTIEIKINNSRGGVD